MMIRIRKSDIDNLSPKSKMVVSAILVIVALIMGITSVCERYIDESKYNELKSGGCCTYGIVDDSDRIGSRKSKNKYRAEGYYVVDGVEYPFSFKSRTKVYEGSEILIYYEEGNPSNYMQEGYLKGSYLTGFLFIAGGIGVSLLYFLKYKSVSGSKSYTYNTSTGNSWGYGSNGAGSAGYNSYNDYQNPTNQDASKGNVGSTAFYTRKK